MLTTSCAARILVTLDRNPGRTVVAWAGGSLTAGELARRIRGGAAALRTAGVRPGAIVALLTEPNQPVLLIARLAVHLLGAGVMHIRSMNPRTDELELSVSDQIDVLRRVNAQFLVVDEPHSLRGRLLLNAISGLVLIDTLPVKGTDVPAAPLVPENVAVLDFTSGSTRRPKLVRHLFRSREHLVSLIGRSWVGDSPPVLLCVTPISHTAAPMVDAALTSGGSIVLHSGFNADAVLSAIPHHRITDVYLAVPHLYRLIDHPTVTRADLSSLRRLIYSGTPAAPVRIGQAVPLFGAAILQVYGTTETGGISALGPQEHRRPELWPTAGRPFPWVQLELRDPSTGTSVGPGRVGEVCIDSPTRMAGYLDDLAGNADTTDDGLHRTGDLGYLDRHGYLHLVGRVGNVVKTGGLKVYPGLVERALMTHPDVTNAVVYGRRDSDYVESLDGAVELRTGGRCTAGDLRKHVATMLEPAYIPSVVTLWEEFPLNGAGKPDLALLRTGKGRA